MFKKIFRSLVPWDINISDTTTQSWWLCCCSVTFHSFRVVNVFQNFREFSNTMTTSKKLKTKSRKLFWDLSFWFLPASRVLWKRKRIPSPVPCEALDHWRVANWCQDLGLAGLCIVYYLLLNTRLPLLRYRKQKTMNLCRNRFKREFWADKRKVNSRTWKYVN